jgi:hypothetical protein
MVVQVEAGVAVALMMLAGFALNWYRLGRPR